MQVGDQSARLAGIADYRHVICEVDEGEASASGWKAGFYQLELSPREAANRLGQPRKPWGTDT